jgi:hypothetical protein
MILEVARIEPQQLTGSETFNKIEASSSATGTRFAMSSGARWRLAAGPGTGYSPQFRFPPLLR